MRYRFQHNEQVYEVAITRQGEGYQAVINGQTVEFEPLDAQPGQMTLRLPEGPVTLYYAADGAQKWVSLNGCTYRLEAPSPRRNRAHGEPGGGESVLAPMPAQVRAVQVQEGELVEKGQVLLLLEAMKMEIRVKSPGNGRVAKLLVKTGQPVDKDQLLVEIEAQKSEHE